MPILSRRGWNVYLFENPPDEHNKSDIIESKELMVPSGSAGLASLGIDEELPIIQAFYSKLSNRYNDGLNLAVALVVIAVISFGAFIYYSQFWIFILSGICLLLGFLIYPWSGRRGIESFPGFKELLKYENSSLVLKLLNDEYLDKTYESPEIFLWRLTKNFIIKDSLTDFIWKPYSQIVWFYGSEVTTRINFVPVSTSYSVQLHFSDATVYSLSCSGKEKSVELLEYIFYRAPFAVQGYNQYNKFMWKDNPDLMISRVKENKAKFFAHPQVVDNPIENIELAKSSD